VKTNTKSAADPATTLKSTTPSDFFSSFKDDSNTAPMKKRKVTSSAGKTRPKVLKVVGIACFVFFALKVKSFSTPRIAFQFSCQILAQLLLSSIKPVVVVSVFQPRLTLQEMENVNDDDICDLLDEKTAMTMSELQGNS